MTDGIPGNPYKSSFRGVMGQKLGEARLKTTGDVEMETVKYKCFLEGPKLWTPDSSAAFNTIDNSLFEIHTIYQ